MGPGRGLVLISVLIMFGREICHFSWAAKEEKDVEV